MAARFSENPTAQAEFQQLVSMARRGQMAVSELPVLRGGKIVEWRRIILRQLQGWPDMLHWRLEDVSERRRMERAMREEQAKLVDFMAHAPVGIYSVDQHGRFRFVNHTLAHWLGTTPDDLVNSNVKLHDIITNIPKSLPPYALAAGAGGDVQAEVILRRQDGKPLPVVITQTIATQDEGRTLRTRSIVRDMSPEKEWKAALTQSEKRFQRLFAQAPIGVALVDGHLNVIECNQSLLTLLQRAPETLLQLPLIELIRDDEREKAEKQLHNVLAGNDLIRPIEIHPLTGQEQTLLLYAKRFDAMTASMNDHQPDIQHGLVIYFIDTSEQKRLEAQFSQSQKMQAIGQLAGGIAHDFNNLLTAMIGFCDLLLQRHKPTDPSFADIMQIKQNGNRAANLVRQLLAFSRQQTLQPKVLNLVDVLADLFNLLRRLIGHNISLDIVHGRDIMPVKVDQVQFEQVIINLVVNARDAMAQGGKITIRTANHKQTTPVLRGQDDMQPGDYVLIEVVDSGTGIPAHIMPRIFEPFFSTKAVGQGTGLGLSTVYGIVRQTGGYVAVQSREGEGTTFQIFLPAFLGEEKTAPEQSVDEQHEKSDLTGVATILLVEDEDAVRVFSARALRNKGYKVLEARNGEEALVIMGEEGGQIELLISDVVMPQMDGPTLFARVRESWPELKVIFISGYAEDKFRDQLKSGEVVHFMGKPFTLKQLAAKVKEVLDEGVA
ncbi:MAG: PAS domain-containing sensor histidine kinase [Alphaproteobacteria bacterium]|nr:PAS domain-containing sensor histidine kinase [Alphaproteobacteria bacterium]